MKIEDIKKAGILGAGKMGHTIAAMTSLKFPTIVKVRETGAKVTPEEARKRLSACYPALVRRGKITEQQKEEALSRITITAKLEDLKDCQVIIDALPDDLKIKNETLSQLNGLCPAHTVFTTTSSIFPITSLAAASGRPDRFIGTHFCIPAHMMALVEVAPALQTSQETVNFTMEFCKHLGKVPVKCKDKPGFIVNYLFFPYLLAAVRALEAGLGTVEEIDTAMKLGLGHPMGPFELLDMTGIDNVDSFAAIYEQLKDERFAPPPLLYRMRAAGYLGKLSGRGFYDYTRKDKDGKPEAMNF